MTDLFDINKLESAFGGHNQVGFDFSSYAEQMKGDDKKMSDFLNSGGSVLSQEPSLLSIPKKPEPSTSEVLSQGSSGSSSSSDVESHRSFHVKNSNQNVEALQVNCSDSGAATSEAQYELMIQMWECA
ncbi:hypothetical protein OPV22_021501 [Ensete ventricosum]|uniref:Uncharacterized protein n=1 Tax=Ensete ventricosum TaxID=4639 RepID=A0AAV8QS56_ENSVE|nr:hypothetical protein OPV22_021501 [Ensete ventricosum]